MDTWAIIFVVAVGSFILGILCTFLLVNYKQCRTPSDGAESELFSDKYVDIVTQDGAEETLATLEDRTLSFSPSFSVQGKSPKRFSRRTSLELPMHCLPSEAAGVQVASTATEIATSLMLMSE
eukprot:1178202-Prorocentrum_minimum.AAC.2